MRTSVSSFFCWREEAEISTPWFWIQPGSSGSDRAHLFSPCLCITMPKILVFLRKFGHRPDASDKQNFPCPRISAGEERLKYPGPGFGYNQESAARIGPIYFLVFLRA